jgi:hypothetical protein
MAKWNEIDGWDAAGGVAEVVKPYLRSGVDAINELVIAARIMVNEQRALAVSTHELALAWSKVSTALQYELTVVQQQVGNQMLLDRVATTKLALDNIDWLSDFQNVAGGASNNLKVMAKNLGAIVGAAEVLHEISNPGVSAYDVGSTGIGALAGVLVGAAIATTFPVWFAITSGLFASFGAKYLWEYGIAPALGIPVTGGERFWDNFFDYLVSIEVNSLLTAARNFILRLDPLVLDLDGDGLELIGANGSVLFDHNADGIKTGTGWAKADDGFLVRDINGNGFIDTGRELFGVDTIKRNNSLATDGFDALRDIDSNSDGVITSLDTAFNELKVWRDLDQNGTTSANELFTLGQLGITRINTAGTPTGPQAGQVINNNQVALSSTFTQNGQTRTVGAIDLEANNFFTQFPTQVVDTTGNPITITPQAQGLPQMKGSGMVRDMRAAASCRNSLKTRKQRDVREEKGSRCRESLVRRYRKKTNRTANVIYVVTA